MIGSDALQPATKNDLEIALMQINLKVNICLVLVMLVLGLLLFMPVLIKYL